MTPVVRGLAGAVLRYGRWVKVGVGIVGFGGAVGAVGGWYVTREVQGELVVDVEGPNGERKVGDGNGS